MNYKYFGSETGVTDLESSNDALQFKKYFECPLPHPTVLMRTITVKENNLFYTEDKSQIEDWLFWLEMAKYGELRNMKQIGLKYRTHSQSFTNLNQNKHKQNVVGIYKSYLQDFYIKLNDQIIDWHYHFSFSIYKPCSAKLYYLAINSLLQNIKLRSSSDQQLLINKKVEKLFYVIADHKLSTAFFYAVRFRILNLTKFIYLIKLAIHRKHLASK